MPPAAKNPHFLTTSSKKLLHSSKYCPLRLIPSGQPTLIVFRDGFKPLCPLHSDAAIHMRFIRTQATKKGCLSIFLHFFAKKFGSFTFLLYLCSLKKKGVPYDCFTNERRIIS